ncbi:hypothetical protein BBK36DRAFT_1199801 [Trichoderma citrinoviride]|uniref:Uncharacterized protein n=1 Tax=Trichoderma citrinoviride TaxID=58853 RepID=A0A2T4BCY4_9HYPO|nr:hypothetical protein BBK36DRAFT_1199801 [Trichoderma citrinoviride]PTB67165.1 hypothetical protein BBK36DRAFT_1199801 [Trichoderma citrinoviride]
MSRKGKRDGARRSAISIWILMASRSEWLQRGAEGAAGEWCEQPREVACPCVMRGVCGVTADRRPCEVLGFVPSMAPCHGRDTGKSQWTIHGTARGAPSRVQAWVQVLAGLWEPELDKLQCGQRYLGEGMPWQWADSRSAIPGETAMPENGDQLSSAPEAAPLQRLPPWMDDLEDMR